MKRFAFLQKLAVTPLALLLPKKEQTTNKTTFFEFGNVVFDFAPGTTFHNTTFSNCTIKGERVTFYNCVFTESTVVNLYDSTFVECVMQGKYLTR